MKTIFLDRDGVININPPDNGYVCKWSDFNFIPNALEAIQILTQYGYQIIVVTNQAGIGKGLYNEKQLADIHGRMLDSIVEFGGSIQSIYYCPHSPNAGCECRKPKPGMLIQAAREHNIDISNTHFIGDSLTDIQAAHSAGLSPILVLTGHGHDTYNYYIRSNVMAKTDIPEKIFTNLFTASRWLIQ